MSRLTRRNCTTRRAQTFLRVSLDFKARLHLPWFESSNVNKVFIPALKSYLLDHVRPLRTMSRLPNPSEAELRFRRPIRLRPSGEFSPEFVPYNLSPCEMLWLQKGEKKLLKSWRSCWVALAFFAWQPPYRGMSWLLIPWCEEETQEETRNSVGHFGWSSKR